MHIGRPSRTARSAALHRAAHQVFEGGRIFSDVLALRIVGDAADELDEAAAFDPARRAMRIFIAGRTRFAEDALARAVARGVGQLVVLGAGLDTFAYRNPHAELAVYEVDNPATQAWKRQRLASAGIDVPASLTFAPIDFERHALRDALSAVGFDSLRPAFFTWLGVVPYLTERAVYGTLEGIAQLPLDTQVVFDYGDPPSLRSPKARIAYEARAKQVAEYGEPWITFFEPATLASTLKALGFSHIEDLGHARIIERYDPHRANGVPERGGHVVLAGRC